MNTIGVHIAEGIISDALGWDKRTVIGLQEYNVVPFYTSWSGAFVMKIDQPLTEERVRDACTVHLVKQRLVS